MGTAGSVGATFMSPACVRCCVPPFFIRMCGNRRQRRGDIHVARVRALLHCVVFSSVRVETAGSVGAIFMSPASVRCCAACAPSCLVGVCLSASVPGVINGAPTGYAAVRSSCPVVFSSVRWKPPGMSPCGRDVPPFFHPCVWESPGMSPCGRGVPPFFHPCMWEPSGMSPCGRDAPPFFHSCVWEPPSA